MPKMLFFLSDISINKLVLSLLLMVLGFLFISRGAVVQAADCDATIATTDSSADGDLAPYNTLPAGSTICIAAGNRQKLTIRDFDNGTAEEPLIFVNDGGVVNLEAGALETTAALYIRNSEHIKILGNGVSEQCGADYTPAQQQCGIKVTGPDRAVYITEGTRYIELAYIEAYDLSSGVGIQAFSTEDRSWVQEELSIHNNYIHDLDNDEGIYIGRTDYQAGTFHLVRDVQVYDNYIDTTGRDGIQLSSSDQDCTIYGNYITNTSTTLSSSHRAAIMLNDGSVCDTYDNIIVDPDMTGIYNFGLGGNLIYNNAIVRAGSALAQGSTDGYALLVNTSSVGTDVVDVYNNTIVESNSTGIHFVNDEGANNKIQNNLVVASYSDNINLNGRSNVTSSNNYTTSLVSTVNFTDADNDDYSLQANSPALDVGTDISATGIVRDILNILRPQGSAYDAGAYELEVSESSGSSSGSSSSSRTRNPTPKPVRCSATSPNGTPDLFQIDRSGSTATLYFTPASNSTKNYNVLFGYQEGDEKFGGVGLPSNSPTEGVQTIQIDYLDPRATYAFKVIPTNGCAVGEWSNWLRAEALKSSNLVNKFYKYIN